MHCISQKNHDCRCVALDWSAIGLARCHKRAQAAGVEIETRVLDAIEYRANEDNCFYDSVINIHCSLSSKEATIRMHQQLVAALRPGGLFIAELFAVGSDLGPREPERLFEPSELLSFDDSMHVLYLKCEEVLLSEGIYHASANPQRLSRLVARKKEVMRYDHFVSFLIKHQVDPTIKKNQQEENDVYLQHSSWLTGRALLEAKKEYRCLSCWTPRQACYCALISRKRQEWQHVNNNFFNDRVLLLCHPLEFLRSTSSGRLLVQLYDTRFCIWGGFSFSSSFETDIELLFNEDRAVLLYPQASSSETYTTLRDDQILVIPDGSWKQTQAMVSSIRRRWPRIKCLGLRPEIIDKIRPSSSVVDAIREGNGKGRLSTFEAVCIASYQISQNNPDQAFDALDQTLVPTIRATRPFLNSKPAPNLQWKSCDKATLMWARAFQRVAKDAHRPSSARSCPLCRISLASPNRMRDHVIGRRHCLAVAAEYLRQQDHAIFRNNSEDTAKLLPTEEDDAAKIFYTLSTLPILHQPATVVEPPDTALCALQKEVLCTSDTLAH